MRVHPAGPVAIMFFGLLAACVIAGLIIPDKFVFLSQANLTLLLRAIPSYGIVALGVGLLMVTGEFDLSVGAVFVAAPFAMAYRLCRGGSGAAGRDPDLDGDRRLHRPRQWPDHAQVRHPVVHHHARHDVHRADRAPFIVGYTRSISFKPPPAFREALVGSVGPIPAQFIWFIGFAVIAYLILNRHFLGNHFFAAGGNANAARFAGINVFRTKLFAFVICSVFANISGIFAVTRLNLAQTAPQFFIELFAVAICVIGGLSLFGGRGSVIGIVLGAAVLQLVQDVIILARLPGFYLDMFVGIMIVVGVVVNQMVRRKY